MNGEWEKRKLGKTNLFVNRICWGCAPLGSMPEDFGYAVSERQATETLLAAFDGPVNFLDTAGNYRKSEERIGKALRIRGGLPEGFIVATKADSASAPNNFTSEQVRESVKRSRELLGISPLPLVYLHDPEFHPRYRGDKKGAIKEMLAPGGPVAELEKMKREGVVLNIGISGGPIDMMLEFVRTGRFDAGITHNRWNLLWQVADPLIEAASNMGMGIINAAPYASGILAGGTRTAYRVPSPEILERVKEMESVCRKYDVPLAAAAIQFSLCDLRIDSTVVGISSPEQISRNLSLARLPVPKELWEELDPLAFKGGDPEQ